MEKRAKSRGDRKDGYLVRSSDPMHVIMPFLMGERADNEAVMYETYDMTEVDKYLKAKNDANPQFRYTYFHVIVAALAKTVYFRPKMNRYILGKRYYDRDNISFSFTAKNKFVDNADESLVILEADDNETPICQQIHDKICAEVYKIKKEEKTDDTTNTIGWLIKIPRPILKFVVRMLFWLNDHNILPEAVRQVDPYRSTVWVSNLGSIKTSAMYHHLINWSETSIFVLINKAKIVPFFNEDGTYEMKNSISMGFTIDERIADGFYFAKSIEMFKSFLLHPEILDLPINAPYEDIINK